MFNRNPKKRARTITEHYKQKLEIDIPNTEIKIVNPFEFKEVVRELLEEEIKETNDGTLPDQHEMIISQFAASMYKQLAAIYQEGTIYIPQANVRSANNHILAHELFHSYQNSRYGNLLHGSEVPAGTEEELAKRLIIEGSAEYMAHKVLETNPNLDLSKILQTMGLPESTNTEGLLRLLETVDPGLILESDVELGLRVVSELSKHETIDQINERDVKRYVDLIY